MWPFTKRKPERRSGGYGDQILAAFEDAATDSSTGASATAALEAACALYARAFAGATVTPADAAQALKPSVRALIARNLIRRGEDFHRIHIRAGGVALIPAASVTVTGQDPDPDTWIFHASEYAPSGSRHTAVPAAAMLHFRYSVDPSRPWLGVSPLGWAVNTGKLAGNLEAKLTEEAGGAVGHFLPVPADGGDNEDEDSDPLAAFKADIRAAKGRTMVVETTAAGWGEGRSSAPLGDYRSVRFGANPPATLPELRSDAAHAILAACGVPTSLVEPRADGTAQRAGWQRFLAAGVEPLLAQVSDECEAKLDVRPQFDLSPLVADVQIRGQLVDRLVKAGVGLDEAMRHAGFD